MRYQVLLNRSKKIKEWAGAFLTSPFFVILMAVVVLVSYYLALDLLAIWFVLASAIAILLICENLMPLVVIFFFIQILSSPQKSSLESNYYMQPAVLVQVLGLVALFIAAALYRFILSVKREGFRSSPALWGMCGFCVTLLFNGLFVTGYTFKNFLFGLILAVCFFGIFLLIQQCLKVTEEFFTYLAHSLIVLSVVLIVELVVKYCTTEGIFTDGMIMRDLLMFGWGTYNSLGMLLCLAVPAVFWLAYSSKRGYLYTLYTFVLLVAVFFSQSRQCILVIGIIYFVCYILLLVKGKYRLFNGIFFAVMWLAFILFICLQQTMIHTYLGGLLASIFNEEGGLSGAGRVEIWQIGMVDYANHPIFGTGFYTGSLALADMYGGYYTLFPALYHNTFIQILASCGSVGFLAYAVHRTQSILSFIKHPTTKRAYLGLLLICMLLINLFDVHIFCIFSTILYSALISLFFQT